MAVPSPQFTKSWHPISHGRVLQSVERGIEEMGISVISESYTLSREGKNLFGQFVLDIGNNGTRYNLGFRNALDKRFAVGLCSGTYVMVCSNMMFTGDFTVFHKHTSGLSTERLDLLVDGALDGAVIEMEKVVQWQDGLKETWMPKDRFKQFSFDLLERRIVSPSNFNKYLDSVEEEVKENDTGDTDVNLLERDGVRLYDAHGGVTRLARGFSNERVIQMSKGANKLVDEYVALAA